MLVFYFKFLHDAFKLKAANNEPIWHGWYPPHITVVDNTAEAMGTSSAIEGNDGVYAPLYILLWSYLSFFELRLAKNLENQAKIGTLIQQPILNINLTPLLFIYRVSA